VDDYRAAYPSAMAAIERDAAELVTHLRFPSEHRKRIRSTNLLERTFVEVRRRTKVVGRFPGETSALSRPRPRCPADRGSAQSTARPLARSCGMPALPARLIVRALFWPGGRGYAAMMLRLGYALSSEEHRPSDLVAWARRAEEAGFEFALISDHFHPWIDRQGQSPFVWSVIGAIAEATERIELGTGVTCPTMRIHPAIVAQAAATAAAMMPGRFFLGVGTGENLNEHILGQRWPSADIRREMLEEAIEVLRALWTGELTTYRGRWYHVEDARIYTLPDEPPPIAVAAGGSKAAKLAGRVGDALIGTSPEAELVEAYQAAGGDGPRYGELTVCVADSEKEAKRIAHEWWPNAALKGPLGQELPQPAHFEAAVRMVTPEDVAESVVCGPDVELHLEKIQAFADAGFDHVYVHQVGPDQAAFFRLYELDLLPRLAGTGTSAGR